MHQLDSIVIANNVEDLVNQISRLIKNEEQRNRLGNNAKNFVVRKSKVLDEYTDNIINLLNAHSS